MEKEYYLVTGATGFIGFHLTRSLNELGYNVLAIDNNIRGGNDSAHIYFIKNNIKFLNIDLCEQSQLKLLDPYLSSIKGIFHLAALNGTNNFYKKPYTVFKNSTMPLLNLLEELIKNNLTPKILYTGSSECYAYGVKKGFNKIPTSEETILALGPIANPRWSYACGKLSGEYGLFNAHKEYRIPFVIARVHNIYGPRMGLNHFFSDFITRCFNGEYYLFGPNQTRSYCYIDDCINALILLMNSNEANQNIFNVGSPNETKNINCAKFILNELGINEEIIFKDAPSGSIDRRKPDLTKIFNMFPSLENQKSLESGLKLTINWYKKNKIDFDTYEN